MRVLLARVGYAIQQQPLVEQLSTAGQQGSALESTNLQKLEDALGLGRCRSAGEACVIETETTIGDGRANSTGG